MTDITELAQLRAELSNPAIGSKDHLRKLALSLVEALEKAQGMEAYWKTQCRGITDHCEELQARIAELESRTVTDAAVKQLAAENVALKRFVSGSCYVFDGDHDDDMPDEFVDASNYLPLTPLTDNYLFKVWTLDTPKEILEIIDSGDLETICYESDRSYAEDYRLALYNFRQLREVADK